MKREPTAFQDDCLKSSHELLASRGISVDFEFIEGLGESYFLGHLERDGRHYKIYIYLDEVGVYIDDQWYIWERQDYDNSNDLKTAFLRDLEARLAGSPLPARRVAFDLFGLFRRRRSPP